GSTILLEAGQQGKFNVHNTLDDTTTVHWHGLNVSPANDGSPHVVILPGETWSPAFPVLDKAGTYWYHPHPHGETMNQVLLGAAGFIFVRDAEEAALDLPRTYGVDDVPLVFQFKTFDAQKQIVLEDEADNAFLVNGVVDGVLESPAQVVRYRLLNGSSHRYFKFGFADNRQFHQIASDAGLLDAPVALTRLEIAPGERAEILVDLSGEQGNTLTLKSFGSELPTGYPGGAMMMGGTMSALDDTDFKVLEIQVTPATANPVTNIPTVLTTNTPWLPSGAATRSLLFTAQPMMSMTNFFINGKKFDMEEVDFTTQQESVEVWNITNQTMMAHPFHLHGNHFYVLEVNGATPPANLRGRKDVVTVPPMNGSVKLITKYQNYGDPVLPYMFHCHILSHEDAGGMMRQFIVNPAASGTEDLEQVKGFTISPNPVTVGDLLKINLSLPAAGALEFTLTDASGHTVRRFDLGEKTPGNQDILLETKGMAAGTYFLAAWLDGKQVGSGKAIVE
ncbi:MAG: multicopper oxidase domain-containing protein, partial [Bacteroidota bacterium]